MDLPVEFKERMIKLLGKDEFELYEKSFFAKRTYGLRVNTKKYRQSNLKKYLHLK